MGIKDTLGDVEKHLRPPEQVMRLDRMGSFHQTRLSFMRALLRKLKAEKWSFKRLEWQFDERGVGHAVYCAKGPRRSYSLVAFGHELKDEDRSDRVIATAWDATFCLVDGVPTASDIARLKLNVPKQEVGRISSKELSLSRANRSTRMWEYVVDKLSKGQQPEISEIEKVGYLMRTTAVYGSGKFGAADRSDVEDRKILSGPFHIEMLSVYLTRAFILDLVEYMAMLKGGDVACTLKPNIRRMFGIGNSTGLGMAPFLMNHPILLNNWVEAKETALARVRSIKYASDKKQQIFLKHLNSAILSNQKWHSNNQLQTQKINQLNLDLAKFSTHINHNGFTGEYPWDNLYIWASENLAMEAQEQLVSLIIEPYGALVDSLSDTMSADEAAHHRIDGNRSIAALKNTILEKYDWAIKLDYNQEKHSKHYWYVSEDKLEPRIGERYKDDTVAFEQPLCIGSDIKQLYNALENWDDHKLIAEFLLQHPEYRHAIRRVQQVEKFKYSEIKDNLIGRDLFPVDLLRCKLSFFGATHFDPRSDKWVRICMFKNAPFPFELDQTDADDWIF